MINWMRLKDIKKFEIELSSHCNARCPLCVRQYLGTDKERVGLEKGHLSLDQIKKLDFVKENPITFEIYKL